MCPGGWAKVHTHPPRQQSGRHPGRFGLLLTARQVEGKACGLKTTEPVFLRHWTVPLRAGSQLSTSKTGGHMLTRYSESSGQGTVGAAVARSPRGRIWSGTTCYPTHSQVVLLGEQQPVFQMLR